MVRVPRAWSLVLAGLALASVAVAQALVTPEQRAEAARLLGELAAIRGLPPPGSPDGSEDFRTTWITDPDGHRIELVQWPPGHPDGITAADWTD